MYTIRFFVNKIGLGNKIRNCSCALNVAQKVKNMELNTTYREVDKQYGKNIEHKFLISSNDHRNELISIYPKLVKDLLANPEYNGFDDFRNRLEDMLDYLINSRLNRGVVTCVAYKEMVEKNPSREFTEHGYDMCKVVAWAMEMAEAYTIILDDFVDLSTDRRGMPCWHRLHNHGMLTTFDCFYIKLMAYKLLNQYCKLHPAYIRMSEILHLVNYQVQLGQIATFSQDLNLFDIGFYKNIVHHKTEYFMYYEPIMLGVLAAYVDDREMFDELTALTMNMGLMYQMQNDALELYGPYSSTGKISNDIQQGTCTWFIATALRLSNMDQKKILFDNYGKKDIDAQKRVLDVYNQVDVKDAYRKQKLEYYYGFKDRIENGSDGLPKKTLKLCLKHCCTPLMDGTPIETEFTDLNYD